MRSLIYIEPAISYEKEEYEYPEAYQELKSN